MKFYRICLLWPDWIRTGTLILTLILTLTPIPILILIMGMTPSKVPNLDQILVLELNSILIACLNHILILHLSSFLSLILNPLKSSIPISTLSPILKSVLNLESVCFCDWIQF